MKKSLILMAVIGAGVALIPFARSAEQPGESVEMNSLPAAVQKTIKDKAAGGEVVKVKREDDTNGKWNYEVTVKSNGKDWSFEVNPSGKFVKKTAAQ